MVAGFIAGYQKFNNYYRNLHKFRTAFYKNISEDPVADIRSG